MKNKGSLRFCEEQKIMQIVAESLLARLVTYISVLDHSGLKVSQSHFNVGFSYGVFAIKKHLGDGLSHTECVGVLHCGGMR